MKTRQESQQDWGCDKFIASNQTFYILPETNHNGLCQSESNDGCQDAMAFASSTGYTSALCSHSVPRSLVYLPWFISQSQNSTFFHDHHEQNASLAITKLKAKSQYVVKAGSQSPSASVSIFSAEIACAWHHAQLTLHFKLLPHQTPYHSPSRERPHVFCRMEKRPRVTLHDVPVS